MPGPLHQYPGTCGSDAATPELWVDAELQDEALPILTGVNHRHGKANGLLTPLEIQKVQGIGLPAAQSLQVLSIFLRAAVFSARLFSRRENVPIKIGLQLRPKNCRFLPGVRRPDVDVSLIHLSASKNMILEGQKAWTLRTRIFFIADHPFRSD